MNERQQRGLEIAAICNLRKKPRGQWTVPSQSGKAPYTVKMGEQYQCTCPDHETRGIDCKHIHAVKFVLKRRLSDRQIEKIKDESARPEYRPTYKQNWTAYNKAQTNEKNYFLDLLHDLCKGIKTKDAGGPGRPRIPLSDAIFAACFKVFSTVSGRRFMCDLQDAQEKGYIEKAPHFNSIFNVLDNPEVTGILHRLITESSLPMKSVEQDFAVDSSGFSTSRFVRWYDHKYGKVCHKQDWVKTHLMCGVKTNIVTAVEIKGRYTNDCNVLPELVETSAKNFNLREVSGDKGYCAMSNYDAISKHGATPYIVFKKSHIGGRGGLWEKMYGLFQYKRDEFLKHYHKRSNVESTFSMIKAKFRDHVRSKTDTAMVNEVLCKILCHNICVLIQEMFELGIEPNFWAESTDAQISA